jgi:hypothetical protein
MKKTLFKVAMFALTLQFQQALGASEDPRFLIPTSPRVENSYMKGASEIMMKIFSRKTCALQSLNEIKKVGSTYIVTLSVALEDVKTPVTEKDFERFNEFFQPFIKEQIALYKSKGKKISSIDNSFSTDGDYTKNRLPTMTYILSGEESELFFLKVTFSERRGDYLVADFTLASVE